MMSSWCDDYRLRVAQRSRDFEQLEAALRLLKRDPDNADLKAEVARIRELVR
jgi:hypothetical protein